MKRVAEFLRSVIPADPFQLLFLAGVVCLVVTHGLRWWPGIGPFAALAVWPIIFAGAAGYFICFWPGNHPVRRILGLVVLPTIAGHGLMFGAFAFLNGPSSSSVLESTSSVLVHRIHWAQSMLGNAEAEKYELLEDSVRFRDGSILSLPWWKDEKQIIDLIDVD